MYDVMVYNADDDVRYDDNRRYILPNIFISLSCTMLICRMDHNVIVMHSMSNQLKLNGSR